MLQTTPIQSTDLIIQILQEMFANADKIGVGLISIMVIVVVFFLLRFLGDTGKRNTELNVKILDLASDNNEVGKTLAETGGSIREGALAFAESSKLLVQVVQENNSSLAALKDMVAVGFSSIAPSLRMVVREELEAIVSSQGEKSGIVVESLFSQIRELRQFFSEFSSRRTGLFILDENRNVLFASEEVIDIFELSRDDLKGAVTSTQILGKLSLIFPDGSSVRDEQTPSYIVNLTKKETMPIIVGFYSKSIQKWVWLQMSGSPYVNDKGELSRIIVQVSELGTIIMDKQPIA